VRFAGPRPHHELPRWYAAADVFCLATRSEGWSNVLLEALATGLPVVTTTVGGNAEIVREGQDGLLVPFGDIRALGAAIDLALSRDWDRDAMVAHAAGHSWDGAAAAVVEEFGCLVRDTTPFRAGETTCTSS
jgi:glycosyltransferase involved in cell wall biosynthesis